MTLDDSTWTEITTEAGLRELSETDPLTGLANRRGWDRALTAALPQRLA